MLIQAALLRFFLEPYGKQGKIKQYLMCYQIVHWRKNSLKCWSKAENKNHILSICANVLGKILNLLIEYSLKFKKSVDFHLRS